jgi:CRP-like cAMP-binding protein
VLLGLGGPELTFAVMGGAVLDSAALATLTAHTDSTVFALERADFLAAVVGNAGFGRDTTGLAEDRLATSVQPVIAVTVRPQETPTPAG